MILNNRREILPMSTRGRHRVTRFELEGFYRDIISHHGLADPEPGTPHSLADAIVATLNRYVVLNPGTTRDHLRAAMGLAWRRKCSGPTV